MWPAPAHHRVSLVSRWYRLFERCCRDQAHEATPQRKIRYPAQPLESHVTNMAFVSQSASRCSGRFVRNCRRALRVLAMLEFVVCPSAVMSWPCADDSQFTSSAPFAATSQSCQQVLDSVLDVLELPNTRNVSTLSTAECRQQHEVVVLTTVATAIEALGVHCCALSSASSPCWPNPCATPSEYNASITVRNYCAGSRVDTEAECISEGGEWTGVTCTFFGDDGLCRSIGGSPVDISCGNLVDTMPVDVCSLDEQTCDAEVLGAGTSISDVIRTIDASGCCGVHGASRVCQANRTRIGTDCPELPSTPPSMVPTIAPTPSPTVSPSLPPFSANQKRFYFDSSRCNTNADEEQNWHNGIGIATNESAAAELQPSPSFTHFGKQDRFTPVNVFFRAGRYAFGQMILEVRASSGLTPIAHDY